MEITYPQYRKYAHNRTFFKITSASEWEELHLSKDKITIHTFTAKILPDRNYISDMTFDYKENWIAIEKGEYEKIKEK